LKIKNSTKRHAETRRSPAFVPVPAKLAALLRLVNLLPGCIRHPKWAALDRNFEELRGLQFRIDEILEWRPNEVSHIAFIAVELHREIPEEFSRNTPSHLWFKLSLTLEELPLLLQAFVLNDDEGKFIEIDNGQGGTMLAPMSIEPDYQIENNFAILRLSENELNKIVRISVKKIEMAFSIERNAKTSPAHIYARSEVDIEDSKYILPNAESLLFRVRQRLIYVMAAQELISCLTHPKPQEQLLWHCHVVSRTESARPVPYIDKKEGRFSLRTPTLFYCLDGIEARRVRECQICYQFFWAGRLDMKCCSAKCSHALRSRKYRLAYKEKYAYQRYQRSKKEEKSKGEDLVVSDESLPTSETHKPKKSKAR
jgi:hypothetical protein